MNTDRELLELAAKAAGIEPVMRHTHVGIKRVLPALAYCGMSHTEFDPLNHDGDALRLAVKLRITVAFHADAIAAMHIESGRSWPVAYADDNAAATRRAIVRAAAEIGKAMK